MTYSLLFLFFGVLIAGITCALVYTRQPALRRKVLVKFRDADAPAVRDVLWSKRGGWLTFRNVEVEKDHTFHKVDGS